MATFRDMGEWKRKLSARRVAVVKAIETANEEIADKSGRYADTLMRGEIRSKQLAQMGHPFALRHFGPGGRFGESKKRAQFTPLLPINEQTGRLIRSRKIIVRRRGKGEVTRSLIYTAPEAQFVLAEKGTAKMKARGFRQQLHRYIEPIAHRIYLTRWRSAFR